MFDASIRPKTLGIVFESLAVLLYYAAQELGGLKQAYDDILHIVLWLIMRKSMIMDFT
jgi:hypothetical protein